MSTPSDNLKTTENNRKRFRPIACLQILLLLVIFDMRLLSVDAYRVPHFRHKNKQPSRSMSDGSVEPSMTKVVRRKLDDIPIHFQPSAPAPNQKVAAVAAAEPMQLQTESEMKYQSHITTHRFDSLPISADTKRAISTVMKYE